MQPQPPPAQRFVPPTPVHVPIHAVQSLVPQLATAINDIDTLKAQLSAGNANATFPSWDALLQRYTLLLTRVQSLTKYISEPAKSSSLLPPSLSSTAPPPPPGGVNTTTRGEPALAHYLVHPLRALPSDAEPLAQDVLFQAINTQSLDSTTTHGTVLGLDALRALDETALQRLSDRLKARLGREGERARGLAREIERRAEEYDWAYRPDAKDEGEEEEEEEEEDLFGDDEDEESQGAGGKAQDKLEENPRPGWDVSDYLAFLEQGKVKPPPQAEAAAPTVVA